MIKLIMFLCVFFSFPLMAGEGHDHGDSAFANTEVSTSFDLTDAQIANLSIKTDIVKDVDFYESVTIPVIVRSNALSSGGGHFYVQGFMMSSPDVQKIRKGQAVLVYLDNLPEKEIKGKVVDIDDMDPKTRMHSVRIDVNGALSRLLHLSGGTGTILLSKLEKETGVPKSAVLGEFGTFFVFVRKENHFEHRSVVLGHETGNNIEIVAGVENGEQVVVQGNYQLQFVTAGSHDDHDHEAEENAKHDDDHDHSDDEKGLHAEHKGDHNHDAPAHNHKEEPKNHVKHNHPENVPCDHDHGPTDKGRL